MLGRERLANSKSNLHFILITTDISENSRDEMLDEFSHYPVVQYFTSEELAQLLQLKGNTKVVGFAKSSLAKSIYAELKEHRLNMPTKKGTEKDDGEQQAESGSEPKPRKKSKARTRSTPAKRSIGKRRPKGKPRSGSEG